MGTKPHDAHHAAVAAAIVHARDQPLGVAGNLEKLAAAASLSPFHFHRIFKKLTGRTPDDHLRSIRLVRAAIALRTTSRPILHVALNAGYQNHESFSRAFRKEFRLSPRAYRNRHLSRGSTMKSLNPAVNLVKIPVTDFNRAAAWYRDVLGLEEEFAVEKYGWAQYKAGDLPLCLYVVGKGGGDGKPGNELNFHLAVDDAVKAHALLKSRAGKASDLVSSDDGGKFFLVTDPDGNSFKIIQRA